MSTGKGKILVIRGGAIGDFILTLPVLAALRSHLPTAGLEVLGYSHIVQLALAGGLVDKVRPIDSRPLAGFFARQGSLDPDLSAYFAEFALILSFLYDPEHIFETNIARCSKAQFIAGPHRPDEAEDLHATEVLLKPLERVAIFDADPIPHLRLNAPDPRETTASTGTVWLACHPGSGSESKNWPETHWRKFIGHLVATTNLSLLLVGGEAEGDKLTRLAENIPPNRRCVVQGMPLPHLAMELASCRAFVGHDSGISHLAAALGLPGLVLWGPTRQTIWRPRSDRIQLLHEPAGLVELTVDRVAKHLQELLER